ncbi:DUF4292 domain-containing protein [Dysgonomonas sp. Marseille-P4361]|uniref:DUF4292 domain-containing protein n=1 Tax=Dysgonomonas sp. Marseille-P4361 TaxID=2161820 RepID=UPI000D55E324|nr:DUF4292 domain-containing protein [Dysgonomonas sp. Marseille-P4361]
MKTLTPRNIITLFSIIFLIFTVSSCGSKKTVTTGGVLEKKSSTKIINDALHSELKYSTLTTKGSIEFKIGDSSKKSTTVFKIIKDSIMQASVRPMLGMEAFRISFTPDSIIVLDRLKKQYIAESIKDSKLMANFDFNYYNLQALFTNQLFTPGKQNVSKSDYEKYNISATDDVYMLQTKDKGNLLYNFAIDASNRIISTLIYNDKKNVTLQWSYGEFIKEGSAMYPTTMNAQVDIAKKRLDIGITYNKLDIDKDLSIDTSVPAKYTKVDFSDFIGTYIKKK